jgi:hypothetical protein
MLWKGFAGIGISKECSSSRRRWLFRASHASDLSLSHILLQARVEVIPPFEQHAFADEFEPRCEFERLVLEHGLEVFLRDPSRVPSLVGVHVQVDVGFDEQDVVNYTNVSIVTVFTTQTGAFSLEPQDNLLSCSPHLPSLGDL